MLGNGSGSDDPQTPSYKKIAGRDVKPGKQIAHEMLPSRHARATITGGDMIQRSMNNYSKMSPDYLPPSQGLSKGGRVRSSKKR